MFLDNMIYFMGASYYRYYNGGANIILIDGVIMLRIVWKMWSITIITVTLLAACSCQQQCNPSLCTCTANNCSNCLSTLFYSNSTTNQCQLCDYRCQTCASSAGCVLCAEGYYADGAGGCRECGVFCSQCASDQLCARCMDGYVPVGGVCRPCAIPNVLVCQSEMTVFSCQQGYWKNGDSCSPCRQFCQSCTSSTNCLGCADGYRVEVSAGTYCAACPNGCKTCSSLTSCTSCLNNYRLVSGGCISIAQQCSLIPNCQQCQFSTTSTVKCKVCLPPYYLSPTTGTCVLGSSLLCTLGASGMNRYQCVNGCTGAAEVFDRLGDRYVCGPRLWVAGTDVTQYYFQAINSWDEFVNPKPAYQACSSAIPVIYSDTFISGKNTLTLNKIFKPFYKLIISFKALPLYKEISPSSQISLTVTLRDNSSTPLQYTQPITTSDHVACRPFYSTLQSKIVKDQNISIVLQARLVNSSLAENLFPKGLIGYSQILIQLYRCSPECRICSNSKYCIECYSNLFVYENKCVSECYGFYQFYVPWGNVTNYTSKSCLQKCPTGFYPALHPTKTGVPICTQCKAPCVACKSELECLSCVAPYYFYDLEFKCLLDCPLTHYQESGVASSGPVCAPCNSPCRTCTNSSQCLSCAIGYFFPGNSTCAGLCPDLYFANRVTKVCEPCDPKCSRCANSPTNCLSCLTGFFLLNNACLQSCPALTHYPISSRCQQCKPPCLQCTSELACVNCISGYLLNSQCYNTCPDGYYGNFTGNTCQPCPDRNCARCLSATSCQLCTNGTYLNNGACLVSCPSRAYPITGVGSVGNTCVPCLQPCFQCLNASYCVSCQIGYMSSLVPGTCIGICQTGYYPYETTLSITSPSYNSLTIIKQCQSCSPECLTCKDLTSCLSCKNSSMVLDPMRKCVPECPIGYYNHARVCQMCNYPCLACVTGPQVCLSCQQPYILAGSACISQCGTTQYQKDYQCFACQGLCRTCLNETHCTSCVLSSDNVNTTQTYLWNSQCIIACPISTYADPITLRCKACNYPCQQCLDSKKCLTCASGYLNPLKMSCQMCPQTSFANETSKQCQPCNTTINNCRICSSATVCRYCTSSYYLYQSRCIDELECKSLGTYYANSQQMVCSSCVAPCGSCLSENQCTSCVTGFLHNMKCLLECPNGYYAALVSSRCQPCDLGVCLTCSLGSTSCLSCNVTSSRPVFMSSQSTCIPANQCPPQFYIDYSFGFGRCIRCEPPCLTCSSSRQCLSCLTGILFNNECKTSCPLSFYQHQTQSNTSSSVQCLPCSTNCLQCRNTSQYCISCPQDYYLQVSRCVSQCGDGFYLDSSTLMCKVCNSPCRTCTSASICLSCLDTNVNGSATTGRIIYFGQCLETCPDGTYQNDKQCSKCPKECQLCGTRPLVSQPTSLQIYCKKCGEGLFMNSTTPGKCSPVCLPSEYPDSYARSCYSCQSPCLTCQSATGCNSCQQGYIIYKHDCIKGTLCPQGTYKYENSNGMVECVDRCPLPFYGSTFTRECVRDCPYNYVKYAPSSSCIQTCPSGYFLVTDLLCQECSNGNCPSDLLRMSIKSKSIFNTLYIRITFNQQTNLHSIKKYQNMSSPAMLTLEAQPLSNIYTNEYTTSRLLQQQPANPLALPYEIQPILATNAVWLKILPENSLPIMQLRVAMSGYYIFGEKVLQNCNASTILYGYDRYSAEEISQGIGFENYAKIISCIMCILFLINLVFNTGYLMYSMVDFYQLLFLLLFLSIDYPPILNYFLYGFRYAHYLFLPQIFSTGQQNGTISDKIPQKFGIIVPDAYFLTNTGHDFLIMFVVVGVFSLLKLADFVGDCIGKSNKIKNQLEQNANKLQGSQNMDKNEHQKSDTECKKSQQSQSATPPTNLSSPPASLPSKVHTTIKTVLNRIRWNYFNDFLYVMYLYLMLFAFCQTLDLNAKQGIHYASSIFAIVFVVLGVCWPVGLGVMLFLRNRQAMVFKEQQYSNEEAYFEEYKCYVANLKPKSTNMFGLMLSPIRYFKKLLLAILFSYCSNYQNFILAIITTLSILSILITIVYKPYKNRLTHYSVCLFDVLFCLGCILLSILMSNTGLQREGKIGISLAAVVVFMALSIVICGYNCGVIGMHCVGYWTGIDYVGKYDYQEEITQGKDKQGDENQQGSQNNAISEDSNLRLNITLKNAQQKGRKLSNEYLIAKNSTDSKPSTKRNANPNQQPNPYAQSQQSEQSDALDIYLKQGDGMSKKTPQVLIKCVKGHKFESSDEEGDDQEAKDEGNQEEDSRKGGHCEKRNRYQSQKNQLQSQMEQRQSQYQQNHKQRSDKQSQNEDKIEKEDKIIFDQNSPNKSQLPGLNPLLILSDNNLQQLQSVQYPQQPHQNEPK